MLDGKKTYIGIATAALPVVAGFFGYNIAVGGVEELGGLLGSLLNNIESVITSAGLLLAWYGRKVTKG